MAKHKDWFAARRTAVLVISFAEPAVLRAYQEKRQWPFPLFADPRRTIYQQLGLERLATRQLVGWRTAQSYLRSLWSGRGLQYYGKEDVYQAGGDFVIDRNGAVRYAHRGREPGDRPSVAELMKALESLAESRGAAPDAPPLS